jgi:hypothetical protein
MSAFVLLLVVKSLTGRPMRRSGKGQTQAGRSAGAGSGKGPGEGIPHA